MPINGQNHINGAPKNGMGLSINTLPRPKAGQSRVLSQILDIQAVLYRDSINMSLTPKERALSASAYQRIEAQRRCNLGLPNPGQLRPEMPIKGRKLKQVSAWSEPRQIVDVQSEPVKPGTPAAPQVVPLDHDEVAPSATQPEP